MDTPMDKLVSTDNESSTSYGNDTMNATTLTDLQQSNRTSDDSAEDNDTLTGANPGYADTRNPLDGAGSEPNVNDDLAMLDSDSDLSTTTRLEQDYNDNDGDSEPGQINNTYTPVSLDEEASKSNLESGIHNDDDDHDQQQDIVDTITTSEEETNNTTVEDTIHNDNDDTLREDGDDDISGNLQQNDDIVDDDGDADMEMDTQREAVEQEQGDDTIDTLGLTLDQALEGLMESGYRATTSVSPLDDDSKIYGVPSSSHFSSPTQSNTTTTIGYENMDEMAMVDFSCWLYAAIFVLICLRLPYVKRYFTRVNNNEDHTFSNDTLPYHTIQNKELD
ncbi:unnamed protein product [Absidia cylindrospora]